MYVADLKKKFLILAILCFQRLKFSFWKFEASPNAPCLQVSVCLRVMPRLGWWKQCILGHYEVWLILVVFLSKILIYLVHLVIRARSQGVIFNSSIHLISKAWESPRLVRKCVYSFFPTPPVQTWIRPSPLNHSSSFCWVFYLYTIPANQPSTPIGGLPILLSCHVQTPYHGLWPITMCRPSCMSLTFTTFILLAGKLLLNLHALPH